MIHVQIACDVTPQGVRGVRWVLVEPALPLPELQEPAAVAKAVPAEQPAAASTAPVADGLRLGALKALAVALGLGAALWTAALQIGMPGAGRPAGAAPAALPVPAPTPPTPATPAALPPALSLPASPVPQAPAVRATPSAPAVTPAPAASDGPSRLTASLS